MLRLRGGKDSESSKNLAKMFTRQVTDKLTRFFTEDMQAWCNYANRSYVASICLLMIHQYECAQFNMNSELYDLILNGNNSSLQFSGAYKNNENIKLVVMDKWNSDIVSLIFYATLIVNLVLLSAILIKLLCYLFDYKVPTIYALSFAFRAYSYTIFVAAMYASLLSTSNNLYLAIYNIILSVILEILLTIQDFDFRFTRQDWLARKQDTREIIFILLKVICMLINKMATAKVLPFATFAFHASKLIHYFRNHPFQDFTIQSIEFSMTAVNLYFSSVTILGLLGNINLDYILIFLSSTPLSFLAAKHIFDSRVTSTVTRIAALLHDSMQISQRYTNKSAAQNNLGNTISKVSIPVSLMNVKRSDQNYADIDLFLRYLYSHVECKLSKYLESPFSLILDNIVANHHETCNLYPNCFCKKQIENSQSNSDMSRSDFIDDSIRKQYLIHFISAVYSSELRVLKNKTHSIFLNNLSFLITSVKNQTMSYREIFYLRNLIYASSLSEKSTINNTGGNGGNGTTSSRGSIIQKLTIQYFLRLAASEFEIDAQRIITAHEGEIIHIIDYDESLNKCSSVYRMCLSLKLEFLSSLCQDFINLESLEESALDLHKRRGYLLSELKRLFALNSQNRTLQNICEGYQECLTIDDVFSRMHSAKIKSGLNLNSIKYYSDDSAAIYISLMSEIGKVKKVSRNFSEIVPLVKENAEAIGRNVNFMQVDEIAVIHDQILLSFVNKKKLNHNIKPFPLLFGKDAKGWAIVYEMKVQICMLANEELGVCGWLKQIDNDSMYIMATTAVDNYRIIIQDETFFNTFFSGSLTQAETKKVRLGNLMPMLDVLANQGQQGVVYETLIICPNSMKQCGQQYDIQSNTNALISSLNKLHLFQIRFAIYKDSNQFFPFISMQIVSLRNLSDQTIKREAIQNFRMQAHEAFGNVYTRRSGSQITRVFESSTQNSGMNQYANGLQNAGMTGISDEIDEQLAFDFQNSNVNLNESQDSKQMKLMRTLRAGHTNEYEKNHSLISFQELSLHTQSHNNHHGIGATPRHFNQHHHQANFDKHDPFSLKQIVAQQPVTPQTQQATGDTPQFSKRSIGGNSEGYIKDASVFGNHSLPETRKALSAYTDVSKTQRNFSEFTGIGGAAGGESSNTSRHFLGDKSASEDHLFSNTTTKQQQQQQLTTTNYNDTQHYEHGIEMQMTQNILSHDSFQFSPNSSKFFTTLTKENHHNNNVIQQQLQHQNHSNKLNTTTLQEERNNKTSGIIATSTMNLNTEQATISNTGKTAAATTPTAKEKMIKAAQTVLRRVSIVNFMDRLPKLKSANNNNSNNNKSNFNNVTDSLNSSSKEFSEPYCAQPEEGRFEDKDKEGSVKTGVNSKYAAKQQIVRSIRSKKESSGLIAINIIGIISIFIICSLNMISYWVQYNDLIDQQANFKVIQWSMGLKKSMSLMFAGSALLKSTYLGHYALYSLEEIQGFMQSVMTSNVYLHSEFKNLTQNQVQGDSTQIYIYRLSSDEKMSFSISNIMKFTETTLYSESIQYSLMQLQTMLYYVMYNQDSMFYNELMVGGNYITTFSVLDTIYQLNLDNFNEQVDYRKVLITVQLIVISIVTGILSLLIAPIYAYSQIKREDILYLFATFPYEKIAMMSSRTVMFLESHDRMEVSKSAALSRFSTVFQKQQNLTSQSKIKGNDSLTRKKKNISSTSSLPRITKKIFFGVCAALVFAQFYPIIQYIVGFTQIEVFNKQVDFLASLEFFFDIMASMVSIKYQTTLILLYGYQGGDSSSVQSFVTASKMYYEKVDGYYETLMKNIDVYRDYSGSQQSEFEEFLLPIFEKDACATLRDHVHDHAREVKINYTTCDSIFGGVLASGLQVAIQKLVTHFKTYMDGFLTLDVAKFKSVMLGLQGDLSIVNEFKFTDIIFEIVQEIHYFFYDVYDVIFEADNLQSLILLCVQLAVLFFILIFGWKKFYNMLGEQLFSTKQLLDLIESNTLLENPYVLSYFKSLR